MSYNSRLDDKDVRPLYVQISEVVESGINDGAYGPGDRLPSEKELCEYYGVSRITVRQALQRLVENEKLVKVPGKGTFVKEFSKKPKIWGPRNLDETLRDQGYEVSNLILSLKESEIPFWIGNYMASAEKIFEVSRLKSINNQPFALEYRVIPQDIASRYALKELGEGQLFDLLARYSDTAILNLSYFFDLTELTKAQAGKFNLDGGEPAIIRTGIYYSEKFNKEENPIMMSRLIYLPAMVKIRFDFTKSLSGWEVIKNNKL